jgi:hypothetical protein
MYFKFRVEENICLGLYPADDPDIKLMEEMAELLRENCQETSQLGYNKFFEEVKKATDIKGKKKFDRLVRKGEKRFWLKSDGGRGRKTFISPINWN